LAGTGSGALTIALCRATGPEGRVVSYELRSDHRDQGSANVEAFFGVLPGWLTLRDGDVAVADVHADHVVSGLQQLGDQVTADEAG